MEKTLKSFLIPKTKIDLNKQPQAKKSFLKEVSLNVIINETQNKMDKMSIKKQPLWISDLGVDQSFQSPRNKQISKAKSNQSFELKQAIPNKFDLLIRRIETLAPLSPKRVYTTQALTTSVDNTQVRQKKNGFSLHDCPTIEQKQKQKLTLINLQEFYSNSARGKNQNPRQ